MVVRWLADLVHRFTISRLSTKVLLLFALLTVIPFVVLAMQLDHANAELLRQQRLMSLQGQAGSQAAEIDTQLADWQRLAVFDTTNPAIRDYVVDGGTAAAAQAALQQAVAADRSFSGALLTDRNGQVRVASDPALQLPGGLAGQPFLATAMGGRPSVSDVVVGASLPAPAMYVAAPVRDAAGNPAGALVLRVDPARILGFLLPTRVSGETFAMLVDEGGVILGYTGPSPDDVLYHTVDNAPASRLAALRGSGTYGGEPIAPLGMSGLAAAMAQAGSGSDRVLFPPTGRAVETGFARLASRSWTVAVMQDEPAFLAPLHSATFNTSAVFIAAAAFVALVCFIVIRVLERTEVQSLHDELTRLPNRRYLNDVLTRELSRAERNHRPLSVILLDIDHFKQVNDTLGHQHGDELLQRFAEILTEQVRAIDVAGRYGGEEFIVILPDTDKEGAVQVAEKIRRAAESQLVGDRRVDRRLARRITVSGGVASLPEDGETQELLLRRADQAMYLAKSLGRNQVIGFGSAVPLSSFEAHPERVNLLVRNANRATVEALAAAIDARDAYTHGHSRRVADYAALIGRELGLKPRDMETLLLGSLLHDLGKIGVADDLLRKTGRLSESELSRLRDHTVIGHQMVQDVEFLSLVAPIILHHHENVDGTGYPHGLEGDEIPLLARIVKVADAFDAMTSQRTYHRAASPGWALGELERLAGRQFDAEVVAALASAHAKRRVAGLVPQPAAAS